MSLKVPGSLWFVLPSMPFRAAIQHPGSSSPPTVLRGGGGWVNNRMWIASFSNSSVGLLVWSTTVASFHLIRWWFFHACCASAGLILQCPLLTSILVLLHSGFESTQCLPMYIRKPCHSCTGPNTPPWTASPLPGHLSSFFFTTN